MTAIRIAVCKDLTLFICLKIEQLETQVYKRHQMMETNIFNYKTTKEANIPLTRNIRHEVIYKMVNILYTKSHCNILSLIHI